MCMCVPTEKAQGLSSAPTVRLPATIPSLFVLASYYYDILIIA